MKTAKEDQLTVVSSTDTIRDNAHSSSTSLLARNAGKVGEKSEERTGGLEMFIRPKARIKGVRNCICARSEFITRV